MDFIYSLIKTTSDWHCLLLRIVAGVIIFPYGVQKAFGWSDDLGIGRGIKETLAQMKNKNIPEGITWLIIIGQFIGSIALILGFLGRIAAVGNLIIFTGALYSHRSDGWAMNWNGKKKGEGIEYFIMLLSILLVTAVNGSGPLSIDYWMYSALK